jgi:hypothetical protein
MARQEYLVGQAGPALSCFPLHFLCLLINGFNKNGEAPSDAMKGASFNLGPDRFHPLSARKSFLEKGVFGAFSRYFDLTR